MQNPISKFLSERIDAGDFPCAVYGVLEKGQLVAHDALGFAVVKPREIAATYETIFDLASLTKVLITGLVTSLLIDRGEIKFSDRIAKFLPVFDTPEKEEITVQDLLTHVSGFRNWTPFYLVADSRAKHESISNVIERERLATRRLATVCYSDINFILLGFILEKIFQKPLDEIARVEIFKPLGLRSTVFAPTRHIRERIAASEFGNEHEKKMCEVLGFDVEKYHWRDYQIWGEVHDGNSWFLDGVAGHAGLFSTATEISLIAQEFLGNSTTLMRKETCNLFKTNFTRGMNEARSVAFELADNENSTAGEKLSKTSFGHLGFTGTSLWIDPATERIFILLTNRTHEHALPFANLSATRKSFHDLASEYCERKG